MESGETGHIPQSNYGVSGHSHGTLLRHFRQTKIRVSLAKIHCKIGLSATLEKTADFLAAISAGIRCA